MSLISFDLTKNLKEKMKLLHDLDEKYKKSYKEIQNLQNSQFNTTKEVNAETHNKLEKEYKYCNKLCEERVNCTNECHFLIENELKRVNQIIERLQLEQDQVDYLNFSYQNYLMRHENEYNNFDKFISQKKKSKNKKIRTNYKNINIFQPSAKKISFPSKGKGTPGKRGKTSNLLNDKNKEKLLKEDESKLEDITYKEIDGKIGNKEEIYCFCNYVSYGNMIKCENDNCKREWFHFHCVGLKSSPQGKWFCSKECRDEYFKSHPNKERSRSNSKSRSYSKNKNKTQKI